MVRGGAKRSTVPWVSFERTPFRQKRVADGARRDHIRIDLDADPEAAAAHVLDDVAAHGAQAILEIASHLGAALDEMLLLDDGERLQPDPGRQSVAAEGGAVRAGVEDAHDARASPTKAETG